MTCEIMTCEIMQSRLTALADGELTPETAAEVRLHLAACPDCAQAQAEETAVREMAASWDVDAPDIRTRVMQAISADAQCLLLAEMQLMRTEMEALRTEVEALRTEVAGLRRQLGRRAETPAWTPPARPEYTQDYPRMENDPWNLVRS